MARRNGLLDFEAMIGPGENPRGLTAQTPTGTRRMNGRVAFTKGNDPDFPPIPDEGQWGRTPLRKSDSSERD